MILTDPHSRAAAIKVHARALGFDLVGIASPAPSERIDYVRAWLNAGRHGAMQYIDDRFAERADLNNYFPGIRSVICVAANYNAPDGTAPPQIVPGKIARYARGGDYHEHLKNRLWELSDFIREQFPGTENRVGVDTVPLLEKDLAVRAGIGWMGKNTLVLHPRVGSWLLLGEVLTTLDLPFDQPQLDRCGTCTRCLDACPTQAINAPYQLDATKCISYLTIEHAGDFSAQQSAATADWLFGCDICQDVCPFNGRAPLATLPEFASRFPGGTLDASQFDRYDDVTLREAISGSAIKRVKLPVLRRNAAAVVDSALDSALLPVFGKKIE